MNEDFQVTGNNRSAAFTLKLYRGDGMTLLAMDWKNSEPPADFVGFAIEYKEPKGKKFYALKNRLCFPFDDKSKDPNRLSTLRSPIQKFRWVHFPRNADLKGGFCYRVTPMFMNAQHELSKGEHQEATIELQRDTYPRLLNVTFTRGFVSSQAFVDRYLSGGPIKTLLPPKADEGLSFTPSHPRSEEAYAWMGFETRACILDLLSNAVKDKTAKVRIVAYDLNEPNIVSAIEKLKKRVKLIIDDEGSHGKKTSAETEAQKRIILSAGKDNVIRQHMGHLQHNKMIIVDGRSVKAVVFGSTNLSWRGLYVQANNALFAYGQKPVDIASKAFEQYWKSDAVKDFGGTDSALWNDLGLKGINAKVSFSPHISSNAHLQEIADDISANTKSSLLYSLAFLYQTKGPIRDAIEKITNDNNIFVYGISDKKVGLDILKPDGNIAPVYPSELGEKTLPEPFKAEITGGSGTRMHHKFVVIDFDKPSARVYMGSYNFSSLADLKNGENLLLIKDRRIAVSYMIEAVRLFDHYHFRVAQREARKAKKKLSLQAPPEKDEKAWWSEDFTDKRRIKDRLMFA
jgi:hypothetical protein